MLAVVAPVDQEYVAAPVAVNVVGMPVQVTGEFTAITGFALIVTVVEDEAVQGGETTLTVTV